MLLTTMKFLFVVICAALCISCYSNTTTYTVHEMIITPKMLVYAHSDTIKTISITHTCTCPFNWNINVLAGTPILKNSSGAGDNTQVPISIDRSMLTVDTVHAMLQITSNGYGTDTVQVTVVK